MPLTDKSREQLVAIIEDLEARLAETRTTSSAQRVKRERLESEARRREAHLAAVLETAVSGIITIHSDGTVETLNPAAVRMFGYEADEVIGQNVRMLMPEPDRSHHDGYLQRFLSTGEKRIIGIGREVRGRRKDGSTFPLELGVSETVADDGSRWFTGVLHDITERKEAEDRLRQTEEALRRIHEAVSQTEQTLAQRLDALLAIGCEHFNLPYGVLTRLDGDHFEIIHTVGELPEAIQPGERYKAHAGSAQGLVTFYSPLHYMNLSEQQLGMLPCSHHIAMRDYVGLPVRVGQRPYGMLNFCGEQPRGEKLKPHDDEVLKLLAQAVGSELWREEALEALQESEKRFQHAQKLEAIGRLSSGIAHDFNNLLMGMTGCVNAALKHIPERSQAHMFLNEARQAAHQGASLTRQLLAFSRKQPDDPIKIDLNTVIVQNAQIFHSLLGEAIDLQINLESDPAHIWCDEGKIEQILMNLVVNARDAMPQGGVLRVVTRRTPIEPSERERMGLSFDQAITLVVEDTGVGMDEATRERIFEPFFTTKALGKGTGLGLSTVYGIVRQIKGHIDLTSEPGVGTRFTFYLPPYDGQGGDAAETEQQPALRRGTETVLVVEDEPLVRMSVRHFLEHWGYQVIEASDGLSGLNAYHTHARQIALLVTDTVLPRMSGTQLAKRIHEHNPDLPILYMSAHTPEMLLAEGRINASIELLQKPFKEEALIAAISQLLGPEEPGTFASRLADPATLTQDTEAHLTAANSPNAPTDIRVLLIEDYAPVRNASAFLLEDEGFQVLTAESSAEAMEVANVNTVDIVITDINLPDEKGPALVNRLREDNPELSAIYLSGLSMDHPAVQEALSQPDTAFFEKPFKVEALARTIVHMLSNRSDEGERS